MNPYQNMEFYVFIWIKIQWDVGLHDDTCMCKMGLGTGIPCTADVMEMVALDTEELSSPVPSLS